MKVVKHQFFAVRHRDAADAVAAVKVNKLHKARFDGQRAAHSGGDRMTRERHNAGLVRAVRINQRVEEVWAVVVLRKYLVEFTVLHRIAEISVLCDVPAARAVDIDLLEKREVGREILDERDLAAHILINGLPAAGAALPTAVHEEAVIVAVRAEADVCRRNAVDRLRFRRPLHRRSGCGAAVCNAEPLHILHAVVGGKDIDDVGQHDQNERQQDIERDLQRLFHKGNSFRKKGFCQYSATERAEKQGKKRLTHRGKKTILKMYYCRLARSAARSHHFPGGAYDEEECAVWEGKRCVNCLWRAENTCGAS